MTVTERTELHPVEILIVAALVVAEALITVLAALVAFGLAATSRNPVTSRPQLPAPTPMVHPLCNLATDLQVLTCMELRKLAGTSKKLNKQQLVGMVVAVGV